LSAFTAHTRTRTRTRTHTHTCTHVYIQSIVDHDKCVYGKPQLQQEDIETILTKDTQISLACIPSRSCKRARKHCQLTCNFIALFTKIIRLSLHGDSIIIHTNRFETLNTTHTFNKQTNHTYAFLIDYCTCSEQLQKIFWPPATCLDLSVIFKCGPFYQPLFGPVIFELGSSVSLLDSG